MSAGREQIAIAGARFDMQIDALLILALSVLAARLEGGGVGGAVRPSTVCVRRWRRGRPFFAKAAVCEPASKRSA
jgi:hypothetical protein